MRPNWLGLNGSFTIESSYLESSRNQRRLTAENTNEERLSLARSSHQSNNIYHHRNSGRNFIARKKAYLKTTRKLLLITTTFLVFNLPLIYLDINQFPNYAQVFVEDLKFLLYPVQFPSVLISQNSNSTYSDYDDYNSTLSGGNHTESAINSSTFWRDFEDILRFISYPLYYLNFSINFFLYAFEKNQFSKEYFFKFFNNCKLSRNLRYSANQ